MPENASTAASCPHCGVAVERADEGSRLPVDCSACGHSFVPSNLTLAVVEAEAATPDPDEEQAPVLPGRPEPEVWQHDLFHGDHKPYAAKELELFQRTIKQ